MSASSIAHVAKSGVLFLTLCTALVLQDVASAQTTHTGGGQAADVAVSGGPVRLRSSGDAAAMQAGGLPPYVLQAKPAPRPDYKPGEFERFVQKLVDTSHRTESENRRGTAKRSGDIGDGSSSSGDGGGPPTIRRLGADLILPVNDASQPTDEAPNVPGDYLIKAGDELVVTLWGSVDADVRAVVDRSGRITIPRVGPILVAGVRYAELPNAISLRVGQVFRNFQVSVSLGQLRGIRVYVTGFVTQPGGYTISSLSTVVGALSKAGGPSAAGSFRHIQLKRNGQTVSEFDLYDLLLKGDRSADRLLEAGDVVHVGAVGPQVALIGSVNNPAIFELKAGETIGDVLRMGGGFSAVADRNRLSVERLDDRSDRRIRQLTLPADATQSLAQGDVLRAFSAVDSALPVLRQNKRVRIEGEVLRPGEYILQADSNIQGALAAAGGLTASAYLYGVEFTRESVKNTQREQYDRALRDLETEFARNAQTQRTSNADEALAAAARSAATSRLLERLRAVRPAGRIVLQLDPATTALPALALEDGDHLYVPPRPTTVGVFGSVYNSGRYLFGGARTVNDYLQLAGGPTRGADDDGVFIIRANGSVISGRQRSSGRLSRSPRLDEIAAEPGDTIFVPEEMNKTTVTQNLKDWTQILYQFGLGIAGVRALGL